MTTRKLAIGSTKRTSVPTEEMKELAAEYYLQNKKMNEAKRESEKARKALLGKMQDMGLPAFVFEVTVGRKKINLNANIKTTQRSSIDVEKLHSIVGHDKFMEMVSATKTSVNQKAGSDVVAQVEIFKEGSTNVDVKEVKA